MPVEEEARQVAPVHPTQEVPPQMVVVEVPVEEDKFLNNL
jgi:hypothetical protein